MCTERKEDITLPSLGNNENSMLDNGTSLVVVFNINPHWVNGKEGVRLVEEEMKP